MENLLKTIFYPGNILYELFYACVGAFVVWGIRRAVQYFMLSRNSPYSGIWEDNIYMNDDRKEVIKKDKFTIKHNKKDNTLTGTIDRIFPIDSNRHWKMNGVIDKNDYLIITFWSATAMQKSNGCIYAKLKGDGEYVGYYLEEHNNIIDKTPICLVKKTSI